MWIYQNFIFRFIIKNLFRIRMDELESNDNLVANYIRQERNKYNKILEKNYYRFQSFRLASLRAWTIPEDKKNLPKLLAEDGFYYTGKDDKMECFNCHVVISDWCSCYNLPSERHKQSSPRCRIVRNIPCGNIPLENDPVSCPPVPTSESISKMDISDFSPDELDQEIEVYFEYFGYSCPVKPRELIGAKYPNFVFYRYRLGTFLDCPGRWTHKIEDLAKAGWLSGDDGNETYCFYCGGGLKHWEPEDDPIMEHIKHYPHCNFINRLVKENAWIT
ncbi:E3 ubiquitin-protein ligase XIAP-like [Nylanderia fulva]|uniref:E3 ubiquitin-protein ligase XIAP-like n=1 Tax=Nylanderia fulva TaxID=613905 RepID=UPI0010FB3211|nr:E3 ubiquitin-protein ligase XIAP-like [Nylanderia fulva]